MAKRSRYETVPVDSLQHDPRNARKHDRANLDAIKGSLKQFGQQKPIVVSAGNVVIAGNATLAAARELGWKTIDVIRSDLDETKATAYALADNRTAELAEWDMDELKATLRELDELEFDVSEIGFELSKMLDEGKKEQAVVEPQNEFLIVIECDDEAHQAAIFEELQARDLRCKIM